MTVDKSVEVLFIRHLERELGADFDLSQHGMNKKDFCLFRYITTFTVGETLDFTR